MVSPGDLGELIKPFVFLDFVSGQAPQGAGFGFHPHSGIATLTYLLDADVTYEDTTGQDGVVRSTGLEWMRAGGGTWHKGALHPHGPTVTGFQLWVALPPGMEDGDAEGLYIEPDAVPQVGNVRVLLGEYEGAKNPIPAPSPMLYVDVELDAGESWRFDPPQGHTTAWVFVYSGSAKVASEPVEQELVLLDASDEAFEVVATKPTRFLMGCALTLDQPLVLGRYSVHTNAASLRKGEANIDEIGRRLRADGRM